MAVEEGHVDPAAFVEVLKLDDIGFVEEIGIEDDRAVLTVRNGDGFGSVLFQKFLNFVSVFVVIVFRKVPIVWSFLIPHHKPPVARVPVGFVGGDPKIHIHCSRVGVHVESTQRTIVFEGPGLDQLMALKNARESTS